MSKLRASVIIPTFNRARLIGRALQSVLRAVRPGDEVIVVDDGSTDDTAAVLAGFGDQIRCVTGEHRGAGAARNLGMRVAANELIAFLDSDDEWLPGQLELQRRLLEARPEIAFCFGNLVSDHQGRRVHKILESWRNGDPTWEAIMGPSQPYSRSAVLPDDINDFRLYVADIYRWEMSHWLFSTINVVFRRAGAGAGAGDLPLFAEDLPIYEDWVFCGQLARRGLAAYLDCETAVQYCHLEARLTDAGHTAAATAALQVIDRVWGNDQEFLRCSSWLYDETRESWRLRKIKALIASGQIAKARQETEKRKMELAWPYGLLLGLPRIIGSPAARMASSAVRASHRLLQTVRP